jgi:hypothetical protein
MTTRIVLLILLAAGALAQDKPGEPKRDPFAPSERMRDGNERFVARDAPGVLPKLELRGYIEGADGKTVALLEVEGKRVYLVRKDDTVSLPQGGGSLVMRVVAITNLELRVELGELRRVVVIR